MSVRNCSARALTIAADAISSDRQLDFMFFIGVFLISQSCPVVNNETASKRSLSGEIDDFGVNRAWIVQQVIVLVLQILVEEGEHARIHHDGSSPPGVRWRTDPGKPVGEM